MLASGRRLLQDGRVDAAIVEFGAALQQQPDNAQIHYCIGVCASAKNDGPCALRYLSRAIVLQPHDPRYHQALGDACWAAGRLREAQASYHRVVRLTSSYRKVGWKLGEVQKALQKFPMAIETYERTLRDNQRDIRVLDGLASAYADVNRGEEAHTMFLRALESKPHHFRVLYNFARFHQFSQGDHWLAVLEDAFARSAGDPEAHLRLHFSLAKAYDDSGDHNRAFQFAESGNTLKKASLKYAPDSLDAIARHSFAPLQPTGESFPIRCVFFVGPSRSGKSLLERILSSSNPGVFRGFENDCLSAALRLTYPERAPADLAAPQDPRRVETFRRSFVELARGQGCVSGVFTSTLPANVAYAGVALQAFPEARLVMCHRHPLANAIEVYFRHYERTHDFSYDLKWTVDYLLEVKGLMQHWAEQFPTRALLVAYEDLVCDPASIIEKVASFCAVSQSADIDCSWIHNHRLEAWKHYREPIRRVLGDTRFETFA